MNLRNLQGLSFDDIQDEFDEEEEQLRKNNLKKEKEIRIAKQFKQENEQTNS